MNFSFLLIPRVSQLRWNGTTRVATTEARSGIERWLEKLGQGLA